MNTKIQTMPKSKLALVPLLSLALAAIATAQQPANAPNTLTDAEKAAGWRLLWDGKTTDGWRSVRNSAFPAKGWTIKDGVLFTQKGDGHGAGVGGDIITRERFSDFELLVDFKIPPRSNSGIKYFIQAPSSVAFEYQILDDALHPDAKAGRNGNRKQGSLYDLIPAGPNAKSNPIGEWNTARIVVRGNHVEHWLNGQKILEFDRFSPAFREHVAQSKFKDTPHFGEWRDGHILLQDHGDEVFFRNIKILVPAK